MSLLGVFCACAGVDTVALVWVAFSLWRNSDRVLELVYEDAFAQGVTVGRGPEEPPCSDG